MYDVEDFSSTIKFFYQLIFVKYNRDAVTVSGKNLPVVCLLIPFGKARSIY